MDDPGAVLLQTTDPQQTALARWRRACWCAVGVFLIVAAVRIARSDVGDFRLHWEFGRRLLAGESIYGEHGLDRPYLPFWALAHSPLTVFPRRAAQILLLPLLVISGYGLLRLLDRHASPHWPLTPGRSFAISVIACGLASRFLIRDVYECGINLALVALSWWAWSLWTRRREWAGGAALGFAIALKMTPALFVVWFAWKRQWKMVACTSAVTILLMLSPVLIMGRTAFVQAHTDWYAHASHSLVESDPTRGVLGEEPLQNMSLRPAIGRFLIALPAGHSARIDHAGYVDFLDLPPQTAGLLVKGCMLALLAGVAWKCRAAVTNRGSSELLWEAAAVSLLILLFSPLTWGQHCVGALPALYLLCRTRAAGIRWQLGTHLTLFAFVMTVLVLNRTVIGKTGTYLLDSYHIATWCLTNLLVCVVAARRRTQTVTIAEAEPTIHRFVPPAEQTSRQAA